MITEFRLEMIKTIEFLNKLNKMNIEMSFQEKKMSIFKYFILKVQQIPLSQRLPSKSQPI